MNITFVTGNANKAKYFEAIVGQPVDYKALEINEIQSLDIAEVVAAKAKAAYELVKGPVIVEDTYLVISSLGRLPGPFVKWFIEEIDMAKICALVGSDRTAEAGAAFAYFDGKLLKIFKSSLTGMVAEQPKGSTGFGWNPIFIPVGSTKTLGEMDDEEFKSFYVRIKPFEQIKNFLNQLDNKRA